MSDPQRTRRRVLALLFLVLPFCIIYLTGLPRAVSRAVAIGCYVVLVPLIALWSGLDTRTSVFGSDSRLNEPQYAGTAKVLGFLVRLICVGFGIIFGWHFTAPFSGGIYDWWRGDKPVAVRGPIQRNPSREDLAPLIQYMTLGPDHYYLMFSIEPCLKPGVEVEMLVLRRSRLVLECKPLAREAQR
ncbi:MAG: hypothetical protein NTY77_05155 [Elusimicrobia bacterium]|nr:hypothetical protein [Elusimicrobiota bacterium]